MESLSLRQDLITRLGHFPERVPLDVIRSEKTELDDHTRIALTYAVEAGERISAWLLYPRGETPPSGWPAILAIHQHGGQYDLGKSEPAGLSGNPQSHYGLDLCLRGYVVLCPDQLCFEERRPPEELRATRAAMKDKGYEIFEFTRRVIAGSCLQTKYLHDLTCALDLLSALPDVDRTRLGAFGHSLGGQEALWLTWYDQRIVASVSSCGFSLLRTYVRDGISHNSAAYVPGMLEVCDMDGLVAMLAPRPFLFTAGETDPIMPLDGVHSIVRAGQEAYTRAGMPERFRARIFSGGHSLPDDVKAEAYTFLDQWLKSETSPA